MDQLTILLLIFPLGFLLHGSSCQHDYRLRPIPSDSLPLVELKEDPNPEMDPKERDLNETELKSILGNFNSNFLSVNPPPAEDKFIGNDDLEDFFWEDKENIHKPGAVLPKEIRALAFDLPLGGRKHKKPNNKLKRRLQQWLWAYSFCPVTHSWTDLGSRFWPRFVRAGSCLSKRSCSVPEGMMCKPSKFSHLTILRWRCTSRKPKCSWIPVQYPIITDCKCSCPT